VSLLHTCSPAYPFDEKLTLLPVRLKLKENQLVGVFVRFVLEVGWLEAVLQRTKELNERV
jgi:hypothetical protein